MSSSLIKDKILEASLHLFSTKGYKGTTTKLIAKEAGTSEMAVFRNFGTKKNILKEIVESKKPQTLEKIKTFILSKETWDLKEDLTTIAQMHMDFLRNNFSFILIVMFHELDDEITEMLTDLPFGLKKELKHYLERMYAMGKLKEIDIDLAASQFLAMNIGYLLLKNRFNDSFLSIDDDSYVKQSVATFAEGIIP